MTTTASLLESCRHALLDGGGEHVNQFSGAHSSSVTTLTFSRTPLTNIGPGTLISAGLETIRVWDVLDADAGTLDVLRGHAGTTAVAHTDGELARIAPPHTDAKMLAAMNEEINALSGAGLFRMRTVDLTTSSTGARAYDLAADVLDVWDVRVDWDTTANVWPRVSSWDFLPGMLTSEFASGNALRLDAGVPSGRPMRVWYKAKLGGPLTTTADVVETVTGLESSAVDLLWIGAAWRLSTPGEIARNQTRRQGDSRRAEEVPPGAKLRAPLGLAGLRRERLREEIANLHRRWPERRR